MMCTIHHIATQCQGLDRLMNHIVNGVHIFIRTSERRFSTISSRNGTSDDSCRIKCFCQTFDFQIAESLILELVLENACRFPVPDIAIGKGPHISKIFRFLQIEVFIEEFDFLSFFYNRHFDFGSPYKGMSQIINKTIIGQFMYCNRLESLIESIRFAHLR